MMENCCPLYPSLNFSDDPVNTGLYYASNASLVCDISAIVHSVFAVMHLQQRTTRVRAFEWGKWFLFSSCSHLSLSTFLFTGINLESLISLWQHTRKSAKADDDIQEKVAHAVGIVTS